MEGMEENQASKRPGVKRSAPDDNIAPAPKRRVSQTPQEPANHQDRYHDIAVLLLKRYYSTVDDGVIDMVYGLADGDLVKSYEALAKTYPQHTHDPKLSAQPRHPDVQPQRDVPRLRTAIPDEAGLSSTALPSPDVSPMVASPSFRAERPTVEAPIPRDEQPIVNSPFKIPPADQLRPMSIDPIPQNDPPIVPRQLPQQAGAATKEPVSPDEHPDLSIKSSPSLVDRPLAKVPPYDYHPAIVAPRFNPPRPDSLPTSQPEQDRNEEPQSLQQTSRGTPTGPSSSSNACQDSPQSLQQTSRGTPTGPSASSNARQESPQSLQQKSRGPPTGPSTSLVARQDSPQSLQQKSRGTPTGPSASNARQDSAGSLNSRRATPYPRESDGRSVSPSRTLASRSEGLPLARRTSTAPRHHRHQPYVLYEAYHERRLIVVKNLSTRVNSGGQRTKLDVRAIFCGRLSRSVLVHWPRNNKTHLASSVCFLEFETSRDMEMKLPQLRDMAIGGQPLRIQDPTEVPFTDQEAYS